MITFGYEEIDKEIMEWSPIKYVDGSCPKCGRQRLELCENGKHWCEKCNWVVEDNKYYCPDWRV